MADWSSLPCDILGATMLKFDNIEDCVRFRAVCHLFNYAFTLVKEEINNLGFIPWLLLAENTEQNPECFRKLFNLSTNKCYQLSLPETFGRRCWGSSYGWLVTIGLDLEMHLFNPLTKARVLLPHQSTLPNHPLSEPIQKTPEWLRKCAVNKAIVLRIPDEFVVMVIHGGYRNVAFARLGDQVWTPILCQKDEKGAINVADLCYWDGKIVILYRSGRLGYCDLSSGTPHLRDLLPPPPSLKMKKYEFTTQKKLYLVNSNGELLIGLRYKVEILNDDATDYDYDIVYETIDVVVFRPNFHTKEWKEIDDMGDIALFVGDNHSMVFNVLNNGGCVRNRVYFTDDESQFWNLPTKKGGHDMGALDVGDEDMDIIPIYEGGDFQSNFCTPLWFKPML